jgi:hypothetical protein
VTRRKHSWHLIGGKRLDRALSEEILRILAPLGVEAALAAIETGQDRNQDLRRQAELAVAAARYEAGLAHRQYDAVDQLADFLVQRMPATNGGSTSRINITRRVTRPTRSTSMGLRTPRLSCKC